MCYSTVFKTEVKLNLKEVSSEDLRATRDAINVELDSRQAEELAAAEAKILELAKASGVDLKKLAGGSPGKAAKAEKKGSVAPKYRNPENPEQTWTGRGKPPVWAKAMKDAGTLESAMIMPPPAPASD